MTGLLIAIMLILLAIYFWIYCIACEVKEIRSTIRDRGGQYNADI